MTIREKIQAVGAFGVKVVDRIGANKSADLRVVKSCRKGIKPKRLAVVVSAISERVNIRNYAGAVGENGAYTPRVIIFLPS